jgi:4-diphosphocytidyl-2-C-methyl-D-erythritol kinase
MEARSYAKINWSLRVLGKRDDGFHDLETIFQTISLHDTLTFRESERLEVTCSDASIPVDDRNLVVRAARSLGVERVAIHIDKRIPAGGGLGGGSSNAATTLVTLAKMFSIDTPLEPIALELGSDVPFFLLGGTAYATGRGEVLRQLPDVGAMPLLLVLPEVRVSTAEAFASLTKFSRPLGMRPFDFRDFVNDFEEPVFALHPELRDYKQRLRDAGAVWAAMSGSGSTIAGAFRSDRERDAAIPRLAGLRVEPAATISATG